MSSTATLALSGSANEASNPAGAYYQRVEDDRVRQHDADKVDAFAAAVTGSYVTTFYASGNIADKIGQNIGRELVYGKRTLISVFATCKNSGSGGVTSIDVRVGDDPAAGADKSIFLNNAAARLNISSSEGDNNIVESTAFAPGSSSLGFLKVVQAFVNTAAGAAGVSAQTDVAVHLVWRPSGSYNS